LISEDTIKACQSGKKDAQEAIYRAYYRKMYGVCLYYSKDETEAQDLLQDGFFHLFKKIGKYNFKGSFEGWMRRLFVNLILQKFRSKKPLFSTSDIRENADWNYEHIISHITANDLLDIIRELSPRYKMVFNLYAIEGYSHKEIAEKLEISEGTSKSNLSRARLILQEKVRLKFPDIYKVRSNGGEA